MRWRKPRQRRRPSLDQLARIAEMIRLFNIDDEHLRYLAPVERRLTRESIAAFEDWRNSLSELGKWRKENPRSIHEGRRIQ